MVKYKPYQRVEKYMISAKEKHLFEEEPVLTAILKLAIPCVLGQLILVIYNLADVFWVRFATDRLINEGIAIGDTIISGVTVCSPVFMILSAISNLFGVGAASVMSRSAGKRKYDRATNSSRFAFWGCVVTTIVYCLLVLIFIKPITNFIKGNANEVVREYAETYIIITVVICGLPTSINTLLSHLIRAEGKSFEASVGISLGGILNVALDPIFIFGLGIPLEKAALSVALATGISNIIALLYYVVVLYRMREDSLLSFKYSKDIFSEGIPGEVLTIGLPACLMTFFENVSYMCLDHLISSCATTSIINDAAVSGVNAAKKVNMLAHSIARGMTQGVLPLIGYNKSSGRRIRMKKIVFTSSGITTFVAVICMVCNILLANPLCSIFTSSDSSLIFATKYLVLFSIGAPFSAFAYSVISFFQAIGKAWRSLILALLRKGILDIPLMYIFSAVKNVGEVEGTLIVSATPIADAVCCITAIVLFVVYLRGHARNDKEIVTE